MYADFFWLNKYFGSIFADRRDASPASFSVFYTNMNIASMYLLPLCILVTLGLVGFGIAKIWPSYSTKAYSFLGFLYSFFVFGVTFAGCASLQGAIMNPITFLTVNAAFYIIGILLYFTVVCECIYKIAQNKILNFWKFRILVKATLLSFSHVSPIYFLASTVVIDLLLAFIEYRLAQYPKDYPKCWIFANLMVNLSLVFMVFLPIFILTLVLVSIAILGIIAAEAIMHYLESRATVLVAVKNLEDFNDTSIHGKDEKNVWDLNAY
jgi:hypothetical protein